MNFDLTEPFTQFLLLLRTEILIPKEDDAPLRNEECELIFLLVIEVLQLDSLNLSSNVSRQIRDLGRRGQESLLLLVCSGTGIIVWALHIADFIDII